MPRRAPAPLPLRSTTSFLIGTVPRSKPTSLPELRVLPSSEWGSRRWAFGLAFTSAASPALDCSPNWRAGRSMLLPVPLLVVPIQQGKPLLTELVLPALVCCAVAYAGVQTAITEKETGRVRSKLLCAAACGLRRHFGTTFWRLSLTLRMLRRCPFAGVLIHRRATAAIKLGGPLPVIVWHAARGKRRIVAMRSGSPDPSDWRRPRQSTGAPKPSRPRNRSARVSKLASAASYRPHL